MTIACCPNIQFLNHSTFFVSRQLHRDAFHALLNQVLIIEYVSSPLHFCGLTLDLNTVDKRLHLSEGKTAADTVQLYHAHPDRCDREPQLLCRESVCGCCYCQTCIYGYRHFIHFKTVATEMEIQCLST